jgi:hypothetical protein
MSQQDSLVAQQKGLHHEKDIKCSSTRLLGLANRRRCWSTLKHATRLGQSLERQGAPALSRPAPRIARGINNAMLNGNIPRRAAYSGAAGDTRAGDYEVLPAR